MKALICGIIVLVLLLGGCAGRETKERTEETTISTQVQPTEEFETVTEGEQSTEADDSKEEIWLKYAEKYETEHRFADKYIHAKCWLIGEENIVELMSLSGIDDVTVIEHTAVERVEHTNVGEFATISVFDKTGQSISITLSPEDSEKLLGIIKQN